MNDVARRKVSNSYYSPVIIPVDLPEIVGSMNVNLFTGYCRHIVRLSETPAKQNRRPALGVSGCCRKNGMEVVNVLMFRNLKVGSAISTWRVSDPLPLRGRPPFQGGQ